MAWFDLLDAIWRNYDEHKAGRVTICGITRRYVPKPVFAAAFPVGAALLFRHVLNGYP